jgi:hypothetical protein
MSGLRFACYEGAQEGLPSIDVLRTDRLIQEQFADTNVHADFL